MPNLHILDNNISQLNQALNYLKRDNKKIIKIIKKVKQAIKKKLIENQFQ